jgi:nickel-dependent lactate racemase
VKPPGRDTARVSIPFGSTTLEFEIAERNLLGVYSPRPVPPVVELDGAIRSAVATPLGQPPLTEWIRPGDRVLILSDDNTRSTPVDRIIPVLLEQLTAAGVSEDRISCLIALGTHRYMTDPEMRIKVGADVCRRIRVFNHEWKDPKQLVPLGRSSRGTPVTVNRAVVEADVVIGLGSVVPHHIPGYSGSGKIVQPGICGAETTAATHMLSCSGGGDSLLGRADNPVRADMEEIADRIGMKTICNVVSDPQGRVAGVFFGSRAGVFTRAVELAGSVYGFEYQDLPDIVVAGASPCEIDFWQSHKALYPAQRIVKPGGTIILCTPAPEGVSPAHAAVLEYAGQPSERIKAAYSKGTLEDGVAAALAVAWAMVREKAGVITYSPGIPEEHKARLGQTHAPDIEWALDEAFRRQGRNAGVVVLTHAPEMLPIGKP